MKAEWKEKKLFYLSTENPLTFQNHIAAFEKVGAVPEVHISMNRGTKKVVYASWAKLDFIQTINIKHILEGIGRPESLKDSSQKLPVLQ